MAPRSKPTSRAFSGAGWRRWIRNMSSLRRFRRPNPIRSDCRPRSTRSSPDAKTGEPKKSSYGPWMMSAFRVLAKLKGLRGTAFDVFGKTAERKLERQRIADYEALIDELLPRLAAHNHALAVELASIPEQIRGYGHVKDRHLTAAKAKEAELVAAFRAAKPASAAGERRAA